MSDRISREQFADIVSDALSKLVRLMPDPIDPPKEFQERWEDAMWLLFRAQGSLLKIVNALEEEDDA